MRQFPFHLFQLEISLADCGSIIPRTGVFLPKCCWKAVGKSAQCSLYLPLSLPRQLFSRVPYRTFGVAEAAASPCLQPLCLCCHNNKMLFLGGFVWGFLLIFLLSEQGSVTFHICCSRSCKCSSHHFDPCVLYQCGCVLCCDIPGGNNPGCLAPPQHEKDRVG